MEENFQPDTQNEAEPSKEKQSEAEPSKDTQSEAEPSKDTQSGFQSGLHLSACKAGTEAVAEREAEPSKEDRKRKENSDGRNDAAASFVLGILSAVFFCYGWWNIYTTLAGVVFGITGLVLASLSKKKGYFGRMRTAGFVLSVVGLSGCAVFFAACSCFCSTMYR